MKNRGKLVASILGALALATVIWAAITVRARIAGRPPRIRVEICLAENVPGPGLVEADYRGQKLYLHPPEVTDLDMAHVAPTEDENGRPALSFQLKTEAAGRFAKLTGENKGKLLAILVDGRVVEAATIRSRIFDQGQLTGNFTRKEIDDLVKEIGGR